MTDGTVVDEVGTADRAPTADVTRRFREVIRASIHEEQDAVVRDVAAAREELQRLSRRFVTLERQLLDQARRAEALRELDDSGKSVEAELARMLAVPGVQRVEVDGKALHVLTHQVRIPWQGAHYDLGRFRIVLDLAGDFRIESIDGLGPKPGWGHPHVQDGRPCLGNAREGVLKLIARYELALAAQVLVGFLETYQPEGAYCALDGWPRADDRADG